MEFIANPRGYCFNCNMDRGPTIVCQNCGWKDPLTSGAPKGKPINTRADKPKKESHG